MRLAFLGCGHATRMHSKTLAKVERKVERAYASRDLGRAEACRRRHRGVAAFGSYEAAIADPDVDVVLVATPPASHRKLTLQALAAGKHVIVEKPAFPCSADFDAVAAAAKSAARRVLVAENYFYKPLAVVLREMLAADVVGEPLFLAVNALKRQRTGDWRDDVELAGGGALLEGGIHWIDFMGSLGPTPESARGSRPGNGTGPERTVLVTIRYAEGPVGTLHYSWETPSLFRGLRLSRIYGRAGSITFETNGLFVLAAGRRRRLVFPGLRDIAGYRAMFADFFEALRGGGEPGMTLERARRDVELVEQVYRDIGAGGSVEG